MFFSFHAEPAERCGVANGFLQLAQLPGYTEVSCTLVLKFVHVHVRVTVLIFGSLIFMQSNCTGKSIYLYIMVYMCMNITILIGYIRSAFFSPERF